MFLGLIFLHILVLQCAAATSSSAESEKEEHLPLLSSRLLGQCVSSVLSVIIPCVSWHLS